jgi:23S rRNA pseudouridine2457 synthase
MHSHYLIHKPYGYLSQFVNNGPKQGKKKLLGKLYDFPEGTGIATKYVTNFIKPPC